MARTLLNASEDIAAGTITRGLLNTATAGSAVLAKVIAGTAISLTSTGADAGTGDVTINCSVTGASASTANPVMDGTAAPGTATAYSREDHAHPTDTSRAAVANPSFAGTLTLSNSTTATYALIYQSLVDASNGSWVEYGFIAGYGMVRANSNGTGAINGLFIIGHNSSASAVIIMRPQTGTFGWTFDSASQLRPEADAISDLGLSNARVRDIYLYRNLNVSGVTSGSTALAASATASGTLTLPAATDTLVGRATTDTLTNKTITRNTRVVTASGGVTTTATDDVIVINKATAATTTVTLMSSPPTGQSCTIKDGKGNASFFNITIVPAAGTIDGVSSFVIGSNYEAVDLVYNGTEWSVN